MGTFENTVKLNSNSILGRIVERIKNKISIEDIITHKLTITLDDFEELSEGVLGYKITPPEGTYISEIDVDFLANRSETSESTTNITINHGNINNATVTGASVVGAISTNVLSLCLSSHSFYNPVSKIATGYATSSISLTNRSEYVSYTTTTNNRSSYSSNNDGSITILTDEPNLTNITANIMYKLSKS